MKKSKFPICAGWVVALVLSAGTCGCSPGQKAEEIPTPTIIVLKDSIRYLALGDSYTIGESVAPIDRYPVQLAGRLTAEGIAVSDPLIIARTGWSTGDLLAALAADPPVSPIGMVTLLIGVNNQYRQLGLSNYEIQFTELLRQAIRLAGKEKVFVFSIPDYAYTPFGTRTSDPGRISRELDQFNAVNRRVTEREGVLYFDITPISRRGLEEPLLVANDGLHPSGEMYRRWVEYSWKAIAEKLKH